jgi:hypothetical protein
VAPIPRRAEPGDSRAGGFLQLCSDRRFHRRVMTAFERAPGLTPDEYYVEARPGGAASWSDRTRLARFVHREGIRFMGWAGHGDRCFGFYGASDSELRAKLERTGAAARRTFRAPRTSSSSPRAGRSRCGA